MQREAPKDAESRRRTQVTPFPFHFSIFPQKCQCCMSVCTLILTVVIVSAGFCFCCFFLFFFTPFRYHGQSDEVGCFVAARPLTRRNRYYEVGDCHLFFYDSVTVNITSSDLWRTQNSGLTKLLHFF